MQRWCSLVSGSCGLGIDKEQWLLRGELSGGSHFSSSWYIWASIGSLAWATYPLSLYCGVLTSYPAAVPAGTQFSAHSHSPLRGWAPRNFSDFLQRSTSQDLGLGGEKPGGGEEMEYISDLLCLHRWRCYFYSVAVALVDTGYFERLCLLRVPGMKWSMNPLCLLLFGGGNRKQNPTVAPSCSCTTRTTLLFSFPSLFQFCSKLKKDYIFCVKGKLTCSFQFDSWWHKLNFRFIRFWLLRCLLDLKKKKNPSQEPGSYN